MAGEKEMQFWKRYMKEKRDAFLWCLIALAFTVCAFIYDLYDLETARSAREFGVTYMTMNNSFYSVIQNELIKETESRGDRLILRDPLLDAQKQEEQIQEFIDRKVDGIFINPVDSEKISGILAQARSQGIPVIAIDCPIAMEGAVTSSIYSDNYQAGMLWAKDLATKYEGGKIALLKHSSVLSGYDRIEGFRDAIQAYPQFEIVNEAECYGQTELTMPAVLEILAQTPDVDFLMCLNDPAALGAIAALEYMEKEDIRVYGVDGTPDFKELLTRSNCAEATVMQSPYTMAAWAIDAMYASLNNQMVESPLIVPVELLDRSNISKQNLREWQ